MSVSGAGSCRILAILVGETGPTESIAALLGASRTCGGLRHTHASLYPFGGAAVHDGTKHNYRSARDEWFRTLGELLHVLPTAALFINSEPARLFTDPSLNVRLQNGARVRSLRRWAW